MHPKTGFQQPLPTQAARLHRCFGAHGHAQPEVRGGCVVWRGVGFFYLAYLEIVVWVRSREKLSTMKMLGMMRGARKMIVTLCDSEELTQFDCRWTPCFQEPHWTLFVLGKFHQTGDNKTNPKMLARQPTLLQNALNPAARDETLRRDWVGCCT